MTIRLALLLGLLTVPVIPLQARGGEDPGAAPDVVDSVRYADVAQVELPPGVHVLIDLETMKTWPVEAGDTEETVAARAKDLGADLEFAMPDEGHLPAQARSFALQASYWVGKREVREAALMLAWWGLPDRAAEKAKPVQDLRAILRADPLPREIDFRTFDGAYGLLRLRVGRAGGLLLEPVYEVDLKVSERFKAVDVE